MTNAPHGLVLETAADALPEWGFLAEPGGAAGPGYLMVALRPTPTLAHFDPEWLDFWVTTNERGERLTIERTTPMPLERAVSWGMIRIHDRLRVTNEFLTFGGSVSADREDGTTVAVFVSPAPLLRRGGHSQGWDIGAQPLGAYFGRLVAAAGRDRAFEVRMARADPLVRYAAFVADQVERGRRSVLLRDLDPASWRTSAAEERRLSRDEPAIWAAGLELLKGVPAG